ncbi:hypothetical protein LZ30DRAFT_739584 [Colletotrichum cereale]|nr:hypothetical protein LZ30DRAFT_739584 [Colletotrichum cereale]
MMDRPNPTHVRQDAPTPPAYHSHGRACWGPQERFAVSARACRGQLASCRAGHTKGQHLSRRRENAGRDIVNCDLLTTSTTGCCTPCRFSLSTRTSTRAAISLTSQPWKTPPSLLLTCFYC